MKPDSEILREIAKSVVVTIEDDDNLMRIADNIQKHEKYIFELEDRITYYEKEMNGKCPPLDSGGLLHENNLLKAKLERIEKGLSDEEIETESENYAREFDKDTHAWGEFDFKRGMKLYRDKIKQLMK